MPGRDPHAKHRKALARKKKLKERRLREAPPEFPPLIVEANEAEAGFADLVRRAAAEIDFRDTSAFDEWHRALYGAVARKGWGHAWLLLSATAAAAGPHGKVVLHHFLATLDDRLY